jgi:hypothetical protein
MMKRLVCLGWGLGGGGLGGGVGGWGVGGWGVGGWSPHLHPPPNLPKPPLPSPPPPTPPPPRVRHGYGLPRDALAGAECDVKRRQLALDFGALPGGEGGAAFWGGRRKWGGQRQGGGWGPASGGGAAVMHSVCRQASARCRVDTQGGATYDEGQRWADAGEEGGREGGARQPPRGGGHWRGASPEGASAHGRAAGPAPPHPETRAGRPRACAPLQDARHEHEHLDGRVVAAPEPLDLVGGEGVSHVVPIGVLRLGGEEAGGWGEL